MCWSLNLKSRKFKITSCYLEDCYIKVPVRQNSYIYISLILSPKPTEKSSKFVLSKAAISDMRAPPLENLLKEDGLKKSCKMIMRVIYVCEEGSFLLNFFNYWLRNLWGSENGTRISRNAVKFGWWGSQKKAVVTRKVHFFKWENRNPSSITL